MGGYIAQLVEHRTGIAEVMGSNPIEALIFFRLLLSKTIFIQILIELVIDSYFENFGYGRNNRYRPIVAYRGR